MSLRRICKFGCGKWLQWDDEVKNFKEIESGELHSCPNRKRTSTSSTPSTGQWHEGSDNETKLNEILDILKRIEGKSQGSKSDPA